MFNIGGFAPDIDVFSSLVHSAVTQSLNTEVAPSAGVLVSSNYQFCADNVIIGANHATQHFQLLISGASECF
jgi:hypothetical protein